MPLPTTFAQVTRWCAALVLCMMTLGGSIISASAQGTPAATGTEVLASFEGLESAIARQYALPNGRNETPAPDTSISSAYIFIFRFDTDANADQIWELIDAMPDSPSDSARIATPLPGLGEKATLYLPSGSTDSGLNSGMLFVREGATAIIVSGEGESSAAALGERLQAMASFVLAHPASPDAATVTFEGDGSGGDFARLPGPDDTDVLHGLRPRRDYDLLAELTPIDPTATPVAPCSCVPPGTAPA